MVVAPVARIKIKEMENKELKLELIARDGTRIGEETIFLNQLVSYKEWEVRAETGAVLRMATKISMSNGRNYYIDMLLTDFIKLKNGEKNGKSRSENKRSDAGDDTTGADGW